MDMFGKKDGFFTRLDWAAFWTATLATAAVYFWTLGPSVGLEDSGELATAGAHLGVPHPPGYPFWTLCSWGFCKLFSWVTYMGRPTPAWCISLFSAVAGAFAAGCTAMLICRSSRDFLSTGGRSLAWLSFGGGVAGALTFSLSPVEWSQSTIVEIYSLNALFLMWVFLLSYRWMRRPSDRILCVTAYIFGLGLTNYQVLVFAIVPLAFIVLMKNAGLFRDVFIYLIAAALTYQILQIGQLQQASVYMQSDVIAKHDLVAKTAACPSNALVIVALAALVASLVAAYVLRVKNPERAKAAALYGGGGAAGLLLLASFVFTGAHEWTGVRAPVAPLVEPWRYGAIAAFAAGSVVSAVLASLEGTARPLAGSAAKKLGLSAAFAAVAVVLAMTVPEADLKGYQGELYPWTKSTLVFLSLIVLLFSLTWFTEKGLCFAVPVAGLQIAAFFLLRRGAMNGLTHPSSWWFWWPIAWNFVLLALAALTLPNGRSVAGAAFFTQLGVSFYVYMPIVSDLRNPPMNWGYPRTWEGFKHAIQRGQYEAIGVPAFASAREFFAFTGRQMAHYFGDLKVQFTDALLCFAAVPFLMPLLLAPRAVVRFLAARSKAVPPRVEAIARRLAGFIRDPRPFWQWMGAAAACFFMMSFLLILLANVKGDLQDGFIQKVKFISSHAMIALWIGYGLVLSGAAILRLARPFLPGARAAGLLAAALAVLMTGVAFVYPIVQNYTDERLVFELGGSEQNGHTFGWQFGAYQLEGARAIHDQLDADEEPLPDPDWPEPMEPFSVFFGGTDPGRFVPTYMIYAADYRPDIYLITQNALADDTYMSVMRDLYGDEIWIPSKDDSARAFNVYIDEVKRGVRRPNGDLRIENGRVQVTGALGVMEINGILTKMMFDHDSPRRAFYVEESYVIPWMYPYLSPHGLIMKINAARTPYSAATAAKDRDFWDWYVRRLLKDPMYRRDFAGQKSFSKLRAALAGLYLNQGRRGEAAQAYREACLLYPASPEATFRYAQEVLFPVGAWDQVLELMDYTDRLDPKNRRTAPLRNYVTRLRHFNGEISRLEAKRRAQTITREELVMLASDYYAVGRVSESADIFASRLADATSPDELLTIATVLMEANRAAGAEEAYGKYLKAAPQPVIEAWFSMARLQHRSGRRQAALRSIQMALKTDRARFIDVVQKDRELLEIAQPLFQRR